MATNPLHADLHFINRDPLYEVEKPYAIQFEPHGDVPSSNVREDAVESVPVHDMRPERLILDFETDGFVVRELESKMTYDDFAEPDKVIEVYLEEVRHILRDLLGTNNVAVVEYLVRRRHGSFPVSTGEEFEYAQPVAVAHIDFSPACIVEMIEDRYAHRAEALLKYRHRVVNVWKPLHGPVQDWPLALCKPSSLSEEHDLLLMDRVYPLNVEESIQVHYNPKQQWYYLSDQVPSEVLIFRGGDSSIGMSAGVPHCSFEDKTSSRGRRPRESVEVRALIFDCEEDLVLESVAPSRRHGPKAAYQQR